MGRLVLVANCASFDIVRGVLLQSGPPESLKEDFLSSLSAWVTGEVGGVNPL